MKRATVPKSSSRRTAAMLLALGSLALLAPQAMAQREPDRDGGRPRHADRIDNRHRDGGDRGGRDDHRRDFRHDGFRSHDFRHDGFRSHDFRGHDSRRGVVVRGLPHRHRTIVYGGHPYHFYGGYWYRPMGDRFVVVLPPVGIVVPALPYGYVTLSFGSHVYYRYAGVYYAPHDQGYVVVDPPPEDDDSRVARISRDDLFIYPRAGQSEKTQAADRYECHEWASGQTGYDPTLSYGGVPEVDAADARADYLRDMTACLEGRGYTVR